MSGRNGLFVEKVEDQNQISNRIFSNQALHKMLAASAAGGHLCHAYLFYGTKGVGKRTLAKWFAAGILCTGSGEKPCFSCGSCKKALSGNHPDFYCYEGKPGPNSIHIETIREIRSDAYIRPNDGDYKVYLIPNAEDMSIGAANALLKVLEEPPAYAVFLLTANNKDMVPETIRSRCILLELYPADETEIAAALRELLPERTEQEVLQTAALSGGNLGHALAILENEEYADITALTRQIGSVILRTDEYTILTAFSAGFSGKEKALALLDRISALLRAVLLQKLSVRSSADEQTTELAFHLTSSQMNSLSELLEEGARAVGGNANLGLLANYLTARTMKAIS